MLLPEFTNDEQYLINFIKSQNAVGGSSLYMWSYVLGGITIAGFAAYFGSIPMMGAAFVVVCGFRIYEDWYQLKWMPAWRSIIAKYEAAAAGNGSNSTDDSDADS